LALLLHFVLRMLRIRRSTSRDVVLMLSGWMNADNLGELETLLRADAERKVALDLSDLTLVDREAVIYLARLEAGGAALRNCPPFVREWIAREKQ